MATTSTPALRRLATGLGFVFTVFWSLGDAAAQTPGTVTLKVSSAYLSDSGGQAFGQGDGKLVVFVADLNGDGVARPTPSSFAPGADDFVIGSLKTTFDGGGTAVLGALNFFANTALYANGPTVETGDAFAMFWYPELSHSNYLDVGLDSWEALMPGETAFGAYNTPESTEDSQWKIPNPPSLVDYNLFSTEIPGAGTVEPSMLQAQFHTTGVVIPEPSTALLALLGGGFSFLGRRRRRA